jgi:hypothetical protein
LFGFPEFTAEFHQGMKAGLPEVVRHAKQPFDWAMVKDTQFEPFLKKPRS